MFRNLNAGMLGIRCTLAESVAYAKMYGFAGVDFSMVEAAEIAEEQGVDALQRLFGEAKIRAGAFGFPVNFREGEEAWRDSLEALPAQAELARKLNCLRTATYIAPGDDTRNFRQTFHFLKARLEPAAEILAAYDISLGFEFIGPKTMRATKKYPFIHTLEGMRSFAAAFSTSNVGLLLDIWHLYTSHGEIEDIASLDASDIVVVHINDAPVGVEIDRQIDTVRKLPGETGVLDITGFLQALQQVGYVGPVTAEPFSQRLREMAPEAALQETSRAVQAVWQTAGLEGPAQR